MTKSIFNLATALAVTLGLSLALLTAPVSAGKRDGDPPLKHRDVIADAGVICDVGPGGDVETACTLLTSTNGFLEEGRGCPSTKNEGELPYGDGIEGDEFYVIYQGRNCDDNEVALSRLAASAVLSLDDYMSGKDNQLETAAGYLCSYADKYLLLVGADKLKPADEVDLGADAADFADVLTFPCD